MKGYVRLELHDARTGRVIKRIEGHNTITPFVAQAISRGDFNGIMDRTKIMPVAQNWFGGCILTDKANPTAGDTFGMVAGDAEIVATAGNDAYTGNNLRRGSADNSSGMTGPITGGYRFVWRWNETHGNGHIESVCLTRPNLAKVHFKVAGNLDYEDDPTLPMTFANESLSNGTVAMSNDLMKLTVIDYEREIGYKVWYEGDTTEGEIKIEEYALNTKILHLTGASLDIREQIGSTHIISMESGIPYAMSERHIFENTTVVYVGNLLHYIFVNIGSNQLVDYVIDPSDFTLVTTYSRTYTGLTFPTWAGSLVDFTTNVKDGMWIEYDNGVPYLYAVAEVNSVLKVVQCGLSDSSWAEVCDDPIVSDKNGVWIGLPNGDRYKALRNGTSALYWHNDKWYRTNLNDYHVQGNLLQGIHSGDLYGTNIMKMDSNRPAAANWTCSLDAFFPWVSTVYNLNSVDFVDKNLNHTMTLIYEITEN